jgi:hypothetical protein
MPEKRKKAPAVDEQAAREADADEVQGTHAA